MKSPSTISTLLFAVALAVSASAQQSISGTVTQVVDGSTILVRNDQNVSYVIGLRLIDAPTEKGTMGESSKDHLSRLALDRRVAVWVLSVEGKKNIATVTFTGGNIELGLQMVRDGAAWYDPRGNQDRNAHDSFDGAEEAAMNEKLGVWGDKSLKPKWVREREEELKRIDDRLAKERKAREDANARAVMYADVPELSPAARQAYAVHARKIIEITSDLEKFYDRTVTVEGKISVSDSYWGEYDNQKNDYFAFEIYDGTRTLRTYMYKNSRFANRIRNFLLEAGPGDVQAKGSFDVMIKKEMQGRGTFVVAELMAIN